MQHGNNLFASDQADRCASTEVPYRCTYAEMKLIKVEKCVRFPIAFLCAQLHMCARLRQSVGVGVSDGLLTAVRFRAPLQPFRPAGPPEEPTPLCSFCLG